MILAAVLLAATLPLLAQPAFYSPSFLAEWRPTFQSGLEANYREVILPRLTRAERLRLGEVQLEFPLSGKTGDPFEFFSFPASRPARIVLPVAPLRFFGDLCLAAAWLDQHATAGPSPLLGYMSQTKYQRLPRRAGRSLSLLEAVGVPANARDSPLVADFTTKCFSSGALFILLHELGHVTLRDQRLGGQEEETAADAFALSLYRRLGTAPTGAVLFFTAHAHLSLNRWDFSTEQEYEKAVQQSTHPLTSRRLRALARELADHARDYTDPNPQRGPELARSAGADLLRLADFLDDSGVQRAIKYGYR